MKTDKIIVVELYDELEEYSKNIIIHKKDLQKFKRIVKKVQGLEAYSDDDLFHELDTKGIFYFVVEPDVHIYF